MIYKESYPRDMIGYGNNPIQAKWPNKAKIAVQFVLNYEEGSENCILHGDEASEVFLSEMNNPKAFIGQRHKSIESLYEYGSRVGVWRILELFKEYQIPVTIFAVAMAVARNPKLAEYLAKYDYDICSHGYRWINYQNISKDIERDHLYKSIEVLEKMIGKRPLGWYTGRDSENTRQLVVEEGGFLYDSDAYNDDLPYFATDVPKDIQHLVIPYTMDNNDMRFGPSGFNHSDQFFNYLKDSFDALYLEGNKTPKMMSVGMHCRILGKPGRIMAMRRFLEYVRSFDDVWFCSRLDVANHWINNFGKNKR
ncbi:allantoinase PuuE [Poseidonibacter lekithochrous]|uniref:allantoinase PuuE n=1 Tax=Poseidonibacter TaxID=2321187 RepID=UPI001C09DD13|nr:MULTISPECIES: allantoinase PuuE [Poseidonibacter]MBU3013910.1 allantoinase PuuE [Poseidonibacter lekithochrous]MDO6827205.1 allantoinase PuuE [Poseidonibacter sp. 1_MG-2023]